MIPFKKLLLLTKGRVGAATGIRSYFMLAVCTSFAPCKEIRVKTALDSGFKAVDSGFQVLDFGCLWNLDFGLFQSLAVFRIYSLKWTPDSKALASRFHKQKCPGFQSITIHGETSWYSPDNKLCRVMSFTTQDLLFIGNNRSRLGNKHYSSPSNLRATIRWVIWSTSCSQGWSSVPPQNSINELIIWKMHPLVVPVFGVIFKSAFLHV